MSSTSATSTRSVAIGVAAFLLGIAAHAVWHDRIAASSASTLATAQPGVEDPARCEFDWQRMRMELRAALEAGVPPGDGGAPVEPPPTAEQAQAMAAHGEMLERAIRAGVWTDDDATRHRMLLSQLAPRDRFEALASISRAINSGQLKLQARMPF